MTPKFQHVVAFGSACHIAAGLSRLGLRENSGPFDWYMSNIRLNMTLLENHFEDFLNPDNLEHHPHPMNNGEYFDKKYHMGFIHDFDPAQDAPPLSKQIDAVRAKYQRRIDYFYNCLKEPTLLVNSIWGQDVAYLNEHIDEIKAKLREYNPGNDIIFISSGSYEEEYPNLKIYKVTYYDDDHVFGKCFDDNQELYDFLTDPATYPIEKRAKNLDFFIRKEIMARDDVSANENRIAKERLEYEAEYWAQWVKANAEGRKITDRLIADGVQRVGLLGANEFTKLLIPQLQQAGITPEFVSAWHLETDSFCGVEVRQPVAKPMPEEERKKLEAENAERAEKGLPPIKPPHRNFLLDIPGIDNINACIATEVDMAYFMTTRYAKSVSFRIYTMTDLTA